MDRIEPLLNSWRGPVLSLLRIMAGLLVLQHGLVKLFSFPVPFAMPVATYSLLWWAAVLELVLAPLLVVGLFSRAVAFLLAGEMAFAYFIGHAPRGFFPIQNGGSLAVLYCFTFFYLTFSGPGPWSLDTLRAKKN